MAADRTTRDVVAALLSAVPDQEHPLRQATVASPATTGTSVNVLLDPNKPAVPVKRFSFVIAPTAGQTVWLLRAGRTYICLGTLA